MEAVVISDVFGTKAGAYKTTLLLCRALDKLGINVTCFSTWIEPDHPVDSEQFQVVRPRVTRGYRWDWPNRALAVQATMHIKKRNPSLIFVIGVTRLSRYLLSSSIANLLFIWELTDACGNKFVDVEASKLLYRCKAVLSPSMTIDQNIRKYYKFEGDIRRLPFWVEDQNQQFVPQTGEYFADFIFLGRIDEEKGLRELIDATATIAIEFPEVRIVVGGSGDVDPFISMARSLGVDEKIVFSYFRSPKEVTEALVRSRCLVLPSYHEGYPLVLLEAARSSLPFIATNVGSIREVFGESKACIIVEPRGTSSLVSAMKQILLEPVEVYDERKKAAFEMFSELSSSDCVAKNLNRILADEKLSMGQMV